MHLVTGELWGEVGCADLILVTANSMVGRDGNLVMGKGAALHAALFCPGIDYEFGAQLRERGAVGGWYGLLVSRNETHLPTRLGVFQTKTHWRQRSDLRLIAYSCGVLAREIAGAGYERVALNFPGIGLGGLRDEDVLPVLQQALPDEVYVYRKEG